MLGHTVVTGVGLRRLGSRQRWGDSDDGTASSRDARVCCSRVGARWLRRHCVGGDSTSQRLDRWRDRRRGVAVQRNARHDGSDHGRKRCAGEPGLRCSGNEQQRVVHVHCRRPGQTSRGRHDGEHVLVRCHHRDGCSGCADERRRAVRSPPTSRSTSGTTYYILVFDDIGSGGTLHISMHGSGPVPANDKVGHATAVSALPFSATLDTTGATTDATDSQANKSCGAPETSNSVWYTFTAGRNDTASSSTPPGATTTRASSSPRALRVR